MNLRKKRKSSRIVQGSKTPLGYLKVGFKDVEIAVPFGRFDSVNITHYGNEQFLLEYKQSGKVVYRNICQYKANW